MNEPRNDFENFFSDEEHPAMHLAKPTPRMLLEALVRLVGLNPTWYRDPQMRLMICGGLATLTDHVSENISRGEEPEITLTESAFCMVLAERIESSKRFASEDESKLFPPMKGHPQDNE